jgi:hypothetical protein
MRTSRFKAVLLGLVTVLALSVIAIPGFAQEVTKPISFARDAKLGGQPLLKGNYSIKFIDDKDGQLVVLRGSKEVFRASYRLEKLSRPAPDTVVIYNAGTGGSLQISRIEFKGMSAALVLE